MVFLCLCAGVSVARGASYLEDFNSIPPGPLAQRMVGPILVTFATGTYQPGSFNVLDPYAGHHSQLEPSRLLSDLDLLLTFDVPLLEFSILNDPATNEPGANQINVIALATDFSVLDQAAFLNDQLPQSRVTVSASGIKMIALDLVPISGTPDDEGFDDMILTPIPEPSSLTIAAVGGLALLYHRKRGKSG
jgi:hypothetical protein